MSSVWSDGDWLSTFCISSWNVCSTLGFIDFLARVIDINPRAITRIAARNIIKFFLETSCIVLFCTPFAILALPMVSRLVLHWVLWLCCFLLPVRLLGL